jgi:predicted nucleic acid-binding protein
MPRGPKSTSPRPPISVYDAAYVAAADECGHHIVSCDERDLVSKGLAVLPTNAKSM